MNKEERPIITSCRDCIFAILDDDTQVGCQFDRLDKFELNGAKVVGQDDGEKKYFLIIGRFCNACRNTEWGRNNPRRKWVKIVEEKIKIKVDIIINVENCNLDEIIETVNSAYNQNPKPNSIVIACNPSYNNVCISDIVNKMRNDNRGVWRIENLIWEKVVKYCHGTYYAVFNAGYHIPSNFIETLNRALNEDLTRFTAILPDDEGNGLVVQNCGLSLDQMFEEAKKTESGHMIKDFLDL